MFPSRAGCASHGPTTGEREPPGHTPHGVRPPRRRGEPPRRGRDKEKREAHAHRPPEQRRGSPNRQERGPQRTAEESNLTRTIRANRLAVGPYTSQDYCPKEGKQTRRTRTTSQDAQQNPRTSHKRTNNRRGTNHRSYTPNVGKNTRQTTYPYSPVSLPPVPVAGLEPARPTGHPLLRRACLPFHHTGLVSAPPISTGR